MELEEPHSFSGVTPDTAPTIFKGPSRKYKDLDIKEPWLFRPEQRASPRDQEKQEKGHYEELREPVVVWGKHGIAQAEKDV